MENEYRYYAFISYKREDEKWARWLQNRLESYRLPAVIRREIPRLPKQIRPVFRDKTDLGAGMLADSLYRELELSKYLIVICSPDAARSEWVGREAASFIELGRADRIIPFIVSGMPNSGDPMTECFHPALKSVPGELLGISVSELGREQAFIKVVARVLDLRFDALWNRHWRARRRRRIWTACVGICLLAGLLCLWNYFRTSYSYYADYVDRWGVAEGIVPLSRSQVERRQAHYRFERSRGKLRRVVYANSAGQPVDHGGGETVDRAAIQYFAYTSDDGRLTTVELQNAKGQSIVTFFVGGERFDRYDLKRNKYGEAGAALTGSFTSLSDNLFADAANENAKADIKRYKLTRDERGYIVRKEFMRHNGDDASPACDANGIFGIEYGLDSLGRIAEMRYLGYGGNELPDRNGVSGRRYRYDVSGNMNRIEYFGRDGKPTLNEELWAVGTLRSDENGNVAEERVFGPDGRPCIRKEGYAVSFRTFDARGNRVRVALSGTDDLPCLHVRDGFAQMESEYDERGNIVVQRYRGFDGQLCLGSQGYAEIRIRYNEWNGMTEHAYFDTEGRPCLSKDGYARVTQRFDEQRHIVEVAFWDAAGNPCLDQTGCASFQCRYDAAGNESERIFFGVDGQPCLIRSGYARISKRFDSRGNLVEERFFGLEGDELIRNVPDRIEYVYDDRSNLLRVSYSDAEGKPFVGEYGWASVVSEYDDRGNRTSIRYFGADGKPCAEKQSGAMRVLRQFDDRGNLTEVRYLDENDRPFRTNFGYASVRTVYDERNRAVESLFWGVDGRPDLSFGFCRIVRRYNEQGLQTEEAVFDAAGQPTFSSDGYSSSRVEYDERGNIVSIAYFGIDGRPVVIDEGYAEVRSRYDDRNNKTGEAYFDAMGQPTVCRFGMASGEIRYDSRGLETEIRCYDTNGKLCNSIYGYAVKRLTYDDRRFLKEEAMFGADGLPRADEQGRTRIEYRFDAMGNRCDMREYGPGDRRLSLFMPSVTLNAADGLAARMGLKGPYWLLEVGDWRFGDTFEQALAEGNRLHGVEKTLVLIDGQGRIERYAFSAGRMGLRIDSRRMDEETFQAIRSRYERFQEDERSVEKERIEK